MHILRYRLTQEYNTKTTQQTSVDRSDGKMIRKLIITFTVAFLREFTQMFLRHCGNLM